MVGRRVCVGVLSVAALLASVMSSTLAAQVSWSCNGMEATLVGTSGDDTLTGTEGVDVIVGREGNDVIQGLGGDDIVCAGKGNDEIFGGDGFDIIFAAQGNDTIYAANGSSAAMRADSRGARMFGGAGNDTIHGSTKWDRMQGGLGRDTLFGYEGRDWMRAGGGDDSVDGGPGVDDLHGGNGRDTVELTSGDVVKGGAGLDQCNISTGNPGKLRSCGLNEREGATPQPVSTTSFTHTDFGGETWSGELYGLIPAPIDEFRDIDGRCFLLVGELTPNNIGEGVVSNPFTTPGMGVIAGGEYIDDGTECDDSGAKALGYRWVLNARATPGTTVPFYSEIFIPSTQPAAVTQMVVGEPRFTNNFTSFPVVSLPTIPAPSGLVVGAPIPARPLDGNATFSYADFGDDDTWDGRIIGVEPGVIDSFRDIEGRCFIVLGELTPTAIGEGLVSNQFTTPNIGAIANGQFIGDGTECDTSDAKARGYGWILDAEVTQGTPYKFFAEIFIPSTNSGALTRITVGNETDSAAVFAIQ